MSGDPDLTMLSEMSRLRREHSSMFRMNGMLLAVTVVLLVIWLVAINHNEKKVDAAETRFNSCYQLLVEERARSRTIREGVRQARCSDAGLEKLVSDFRAFANQHQTESTRWYSIQVMQGLPSLDQQGQQIVVPVKYYEAVLERRK